MNNNERLNYSKPVWSYKYDSSAYYKALQINYLTPKPLIAFLFIYVFHFIYIQHTPLNF
jgi:hypothetical protein